KPNVPHPASKLNVHLIGEGRPVDRSSPVPGSAGAVSCAVADGVKAARASKTTSEPDARIIGRGEEGLTLRASRMPTNTGAPRQCDMGCRHLTTIASQRDLRHVGLPPLLWSLSSDPSDVHSLTSTPGRQMGTTRQRTASIAATAVYSAAGRRRFNSRTARAR